jgi:hypothetical protein
MHYAGLEWEIKLASATNLNPTTFTVCRAAINILAKLKQVHALLG